MSTPASPEAPSPPHAGAGSPLWALLRRSLSLHRDAPAIRWGEATWSYDDLGATVLDRVRALQALGITRGDRVVLLMGNGPGFCAADLAIMAVGAVKVPISGMLSALEVAVIVARVRPACAMVGPDLVGLLAESSDVPRVVTDNTAALPDPSAREQLAGLPGASASEPAAIYFSGGTTGVPKGIVHSQQGLASNLWSHVIEAGIGPDDVLLLTTPQVHSAGLFAQVGLLRGACTRIEAGFDPARFRTLADDDAVTWTFAVPTMINRLVGYAEETGWRPASLRTVQYGAAPISGDLLRRALACLGPVFQQLYGQTECPNYATVLSKADHVAALSRPALLTSAGRPALMCEVAVLDDGGTSVPAGAVGEVALRAPYVMTGYWEDDARYAARFSGSWLRTGDVGYLDDDGYLYLVDRRNDMIISGGMNVHSLEVENALMSVEGVQLAAVVGVPHPDWGEAVHAVVVPVGDATGLQERILAESRLLLAAYKRPKSVELVAELPLTRYGKVDKVALRARHWDGRTRSIN